ncbi:MAG: hypothetical protein ACF8GE_11605 [Phycisphaerales bacterium JB043]
MHVSLKVAAGVALGAALAAPSLAVTPGDLQAAPDIIEFEYMTGLNFESARNWAFSSMNRSVFGDSYTAGVYGQNTLGAHSLDGGADTFNMGAGGASGGLHTYSGAGTIYAGNHVAANTVVVAAFTADGSDWLSSGIDPGDGGGVMTRLRMDVGSFLAGLDSIDGLGTPVSAQMVLFSGGAAVFSTGGVIFDGGATGLTGSAVISGVDGQNIDEVQMIFNVVPTPGVASVLGLAGLAAVRRRR